MKTTIDKEFFKEWKDEYVVMWCQTEEEAKEFCKLMHENGLRWFSGKSYLEETNWEKEGELICYEFNLGVCDAMYGYEIDEDYTVLNFEDYIIYEEETLKTNHNLPAHYDIAGINTMDFILGVCKHNDTNQSETFYLANTLKYLIRYKNKNGLEDLKKAKDYLNRLIEYTTIENLPFYNVGGQGD